jgi:hypothetical protein
MVSEQRGRALDAQPLARNKVFAADPIRLDAPRGSVHDRAHCWVESSSFSFMRSGRGGMLLPVVRSGSARSTAAQSRLSGQQFLDRRLQGREILADGVLDDLLLKAEVLVRDHVAQAG